MQAGAFRIGDTAGTLENIVTCKLYRPGSVGFVSKSGGLSNECYNVLSRVTDGLYEGRIAVFRLLRYQKLSHAVHELLVALQPCTVGQPHVFRRCTGCAVLVVQA
jgi:hypothetical protein